eukprot:TRINITY_DN26474_c0_g1_i1.p1 TRINITY_DN26474_c0_g1~~TRINITY_DN26474_c0_g1_i1.p1  ORF type:complete len:450 (-),score=109.01 TRINITY_DN26474_c0_g1_i1:152-1501(-)
MPPSRGHQPQRWRFARAADSRPSPRVMFGGNAARSGRATLRAVVLFAALAGPIVTDGVLRYPDGSFEHRRPLHLDECGTPLRGGEASRSCLEELRSNLLDDMDCNRVICDQINSSSPMEIYANHSDWAPFKNLCGNTREVFLHTFGLGMSLLERAATAEDGKILSASWQVLSDAAAEMLNLPEDPLAPSYANKTRSVLRRHVAEILAAGASLPSGAPAAEELLRVAVRVARRLQLLIENISVTLLLNFHIAQLEHIGRIEKGHNYLHELYGNVDLISVVFHEIPGKRWDTLSFLLDRLGVSDSQVRMAEIGVENANTSQRLLERNPLLSYVGVDPYVNNDGLYQDVTRRLAPHTASGRFRLLRDRSLSAAAEVEDASLDLVFLDARHDGDAVMDDIGAWKGKVRRGGVLSGHDFSWMFPPLAMAVYKMAFSAPERTIHLSPDGVWWFQM